MFILGLTGPIATGKSTVSNILKREGALILDADAVVHSLYKAGTEENAHIQSLVSEKITLENGDIDRGALVKIIKQNPSLLKKIESYIHPQVRKAYKKILEAQNNKVDIAVIDAALMYEGNLAALCDKVAVCTCALPIRKERALQREGMTEDKFNMIVSKQMPMDDYKKHANFLIRTDIFLSETEHEVLNLIKKIRTEQPSAWPKNWLNI